MASHLSSLLAAGMIALLLKNWVDQVGWQHAQLQKIEAGHVQHFGSSMESPIWDGWAKWAVSKTLVICCIWEIPIPSYTGIIIRQYKDPYESTIMESHKGFEPTTVKDDQNVTNGATWGKRWPKPEQLNYKLFAEFCLKDGGGFIRGITVLFLQMKRQESNTLRWMIFSWFRGTGKFYSGAVSRVSTIHDVLFCDVRYLIRVGTGIET